MVATEFVFPHTCKIYRIKNESQFDDSNVTTEVLYNGCCRDEGNKAMRTYVGTDGVMKSDHSLQIPYILKGITDECWVDIENYSGTRKGIQITSCQPCPCGSRNQYGGTTIFYNAPHN